MVTANISAFSFSIKNVARFFESINRNSKVPDC